MIRRKPTRLELKTEEANVIFNSKGNDLNMNGVSNQVSKSTNTSATSSHGLAENHSLHIPISFPNSTKGNK